jgi:gluconokinase
MILIVMGVVGTGKTTVGRLLADQLHYEFADADHFHPQGNIEKISHGIALSDADREPWLERLREGILKWEENGTHAVLACSALKGSYRNKLKAGPDVQFVFLRGSAELIAQRLSSRHGHFAGASILASQMADLEEPDDAITVNIAQTPPEIVAEIRQKLDMA